MLYDTVVIDTGVASSTEQLMKWVKAAFGFFVLYDPLHAESLEYVYHIAQVIGLRPTTTLVSSQQWDIATTSVTEGSRLANRFGWDFVQVNHSSPDKVVDTMFLSLMQRSMPQSWV